MKKAHQYLKPESLLSAEIRQIKPYRQIDLYLLNRLLGALHLNVLAVVYRGIKLRTTRIDRTTHFYIEVRIHGVLIILNFYMAGGGQLACAGNSLTDYVRADIYVKIVKGCKTKVVKPRSQQHPSPSPSRRNPSVHITSEGPPLGIGRTIQLEAAKRNSPRKRSARRKFKGINFHSTTNHSRPRYCPAECNLNSSANRLDSPPLAVELKVCPLSMRCITTYKY